MPFFVGNVSSRLMVPGNLIAVVDNNPLTVVRVVEGRPGLQEYEDAITRRALTTVVSALCAEGCDAAPLHTPDVPDEYVDVEYNDTFTVWSGWVLKRTNEMTLSNAFIATALTTAGIPIHEDWVEIEDHRVADTDVSNTWKSTRTFAGASELVL